MGVLERITMTIVVPLLFCLVGLVIYLVAQAPKPVEIGRILFWTGLLAFLLRFGPDTVTLLKGGR